MMTKGMKESTAGRQKEDKSTNINCSKCGEVVGSIAAGYTIVFGNSEDTVKQTCLCACGNRMKYAIRRS